MAKDKTVPATPAAPAAPMPQGSERDVMIADFRMKITECKEQIERDRAARNKAEKDARDGEKKLEQLKSQLIDLLT